MKALDESVRAILLDIEGTTTPLDFVHKILFPYARAHLREFLKRNWSAPDVCADIELLSKENLADIRDQIQPPPMQRPDDQESAVAYVTWLMDRDRKSTPLKSIQGKIWRAGYTNGELQSQVFEDVPIAFKRWHEQGRTIAIFSSGSVLAQQLLFSHTGAGDLTRYISFYFDTTIGSKTDSANYVNIAREMHRNPSDIVFISDVTRELDAASDAGFSVLLSIRPGNYPQPANNYEIVSDFGGIFV